MSTKKSDLKPKDKIRALDNERFYNVREQFEIELNYLIAEHFNEKKLLGTISTELASEERAVYENENPDEKVLCKVILMQLSIFFDKEYFADYIKNTQ